MTVQSTADLLAALSRARVEFVVVGGVAAVAHGSSFLTTDLDVAAPFSLENCARMLGALHPLRPRFAIPGGEHKPFPSRPEELAGYRNVYVRTDLGRLDILGDAPPLPSYDVLLASADVRDVLGHSCRIMALDQLIAVKTAVARPKDKLVAAELAAIRERLAGAR